MAFAVIRSLSAELIKAAEACSVSYASSIVTNGALLDKRKLAALTGECLVSTLHITVDGPADIHDQHRPLKSGKKTFERIVSFLADVSGWPEYENVTFVLRTNIDVRNSDYVSDYLAEMASKGFARRRNVLFSLIPVHPWSNDVSALQLNTRLYAQKETVWLAEMNRLGLNNVLVPTATKPMACGAITRGAEVISSSGGVFSCTEQPLVPEHERNSVLIPITALDVTARRPPGKFDSWHEQVSGKQVPCGTCWMLPVCGGHCPKAWEDGDIPCPSMKFNMASRLALVAENAGLRRIGKLARRDPVGTDGVASP